MIEQIARSSAEELRAGTAGDVEAGLADLHVRHTRHRRHALVGAVAAVAIALGVGWSAGSMMTRAGDREDSGPVGPGPSPHPPVLTQGLGGGDECTAPLVTCLGDRTYRFDLDRPVVWALPPLFAANSGSGATTQSVESYRAAEPVAGVTVLEHVRASTPDGSRSARGVADDPQAFVEWVADRPFLDAGTVSRTTIDGRRAWRVRVHLAQHVGQGPGLCSVTHRCHALTRQSADVPTGIWGDMVAQYVAFRLPGAGTTVIWSWVFGGNVEHLGSLEEAVHGISFPSP